MLQHNSRFAFFKKKTMFHHMVTCSDWSAFLFRDVNHPQGLSEKTLNGVEREVMSHPLPKLHLPRIRGILTPSLFQYPTLNTYIRTSHTTTTILFLLRKQFWKALLAKWVEGEGMYMKCKIKHPSPEKKSRKIRSVCTNLISEYKTKLGNVQRPSD